MTKASSSIAVLLLLISSDASATECQSSPGHDGKWWSWRIVDSKRCWYQGKPGRSKDLLRWAKQSTPVVTHPDPGDSGHPAPPVPPQRSTNVDATLKVVPTVSITAPTNKTPQMAAPPPSLSEPPPSSAKPTPPPPSKPSKWWILLLIIPTIAMGVAVAASQFRPVKNFRTWWTNWQARLAGHLDLMGDNIAQWTRRALRPVQIDPAAPSSEGQSPRPWYELHKSKPIAPKSCSNRPSSPLTTFDPKSLVVN